MGRFRKGAAVQLKELVFEGLGRQSERVSEAPARAAKITAFVCFTAVSAQLAAPLPFTPGPLTVQTLFVVLAGVMLGPRDGCCAILAYVALGLAGAPVFAGFSGGPHVLIGPTGGYIALFPAAALVSGYLSGRFGGSRVAVFFACLSGMALVLAGGSAYLALLSGLSLPRSAALGALPFVAGELVKALAAAFLSPGKTQAGGSRL
jgi:biotin transport system substrate-specific component